MLSSNNRTQIVDPDIYECSAGAPLAGSLVMLLNYNRYRRQDMKYEALVLTGPFRGQILRFAPGQLGTRKYVNTVSYRLPDGTKRSRTKNGEV